MLLNAAKSPVLPGALIAGALGALYWLSAATRVGGGDWGEFQTFGYLGGIAYPPGYPLLVGSIYLATRVGWFVEPAHAANVLNATYAVAAGVALFYSGWALTRSRAAAFLATVVFATGYSIWAHAAQADFVSLQTLMVLALVAALAAYDERPTAARLMMIAFATGLSLTNHGISIFMLPATAAYVASRRFAGIARPRMLIGVAVAAALGLTPWLYVLRGLIVLVPVKRPENIERLDGGDLAYLVIGKPLAMIGETDAVTSPIRDSWLTFLAEWPTFAHDVLREYGWVWLAPSVLGWLILARQRSRLAAWIAWTGLSTGLCAFRRGD